MSKYQLLPSLSDEEFESLKANVKQYGVLQPVVVDEHGAVLDGHHRVRVCDELGIDYPRTVVAGLTEDEKFEQAIMLNLGRRHLTTEQKRDLVVKLHEDGRSVRWIAKATGISKSTVHRYVAVPDGTHALALERLCAPMTRTEAIDITDRCRAGLNRLVECCAEQWAISPEHTAVQIADYFVDDLMGWPPGEVADWWIDWLKSLMAEMAA